MKQLKWHHVLFCFGLELFAFNHSFVKNEWKLNTYLKAVLPSLGLTKHIHGVGQESKTFLH